MSRGFSVPCSSAGGPVCRTPAPAPHFICHDPRGGGGGIDYRRRLLGCSCSTASVGGQFGQPIPTPVESPADEVKSGETMGPSSSGPGSRSDVPSSSANVCGSASNGSPTDRCDFWEDIADTLKQANTVATTALRTSASGTARRARAGAADTSLDGVDVLAVLAIAAAAGIDRADPNARVSEPC